MIIPKYLNKGIFIASTAVYLTSVGYPAPAYFISVISVVFILIKNSEIRLDNKDVAFFALFSAFIIIVLVRTEDFSATNLAFIVNLTCSLIMYAYMLSLSKKTNWLQLSKMIFYLVIILAVADTFYKIVNPVELSVEALEGRDFFDMGFYEYKNSFFYKDSNGLAFILIPVCVLGTALYTNDKYQNYRFLQKIYYFNIFNVLPFVLLLLTFSRAGIVAGLFIISLYVFGIKMQAFFLSAGIFYLIPILYTSISEDLSGGTKIDELNGVLEFLKNSNFLQILIGTGFGEGEIWTQRFIHGAFQKIVMELGFIGFLLFYGSCIMLCRNKNSTIAIVALGVISLSSNFYFLPPVVVCLVYLLTKLEYRNDKRVACIKSRIPSVVQYQ